ncbi:MAG TPA: cytochrome c [Rhizobiales bacterium]|nr:cytochrome c [Hyphomicrobiales bacterium]
MKKIKTTLLTSRTAPAMAVLGLVAFMAPAVLAHKGATGIVKKRMEAMKEMGKGMKTVGLMISGRKDYDAVQVRAAARMIRAHAQKIPGLFPEGSGHKPSVARAEIWKDWQRFKAQAEQLAVFAGALEKGADNNRKMMAAMPMDMSKMNDPDHLAGMPPKMIFARIGKTCKGCHETFRKEKKK